MNPSFDQLPPKKQHEIRSIVEIIRKVVDPEAIILFGSYAKNRYKEDRYDYKQYGAIEFLLRPIKDGRWEFSLDGGNRLRTVNYIHQVQRLSFDLFDDHLFVPKSIQSKIQKKEK